MAENRNLSAGLLLACAQRLGRVAGQHGHRLDGDHGAGVDALVDVVDGRGRLRHARREELRARDRAVLTSSEGPTQASFIG